MTGRLLLVRHGRTESNAAGRLISWTDPQLDPVGLAQAEALAVSLAGFGPARVFSSPLRRALRTAEAIARRRGLPAAAIGLAPELVELGFGTFENRSPAELAASGQEQLFRTWRQGEPPAFPPGAETFEEAGLRACRFFDQILAEPNEDTIVVGHGHLLRILLAVRVLGIPAEKHRRLRLDHGRLAVVEWEGDTPRLAHLNVSEPPPPLPKDLAFPEVQGRAEKGVNL